MIASGERLDLSTVPRPTVDKHSTGGVGDKITSAADATGGRVRRGGTAVVRAGPGPHRGHAGQAGDDPGLPGEPDQQAVPEPAAQGRCGQSARPAPGLAPADRKLYALRDVTGTVEAIPLIASSIMSKKIAEGTGALVLDVKVGSGAFMKSLDTARELARTMVELGGAHGVTTVALLTEMSTPLGRAIGNAVEVEESVEVLSGGGPADVVELTLALAREMLACAGLSDVDPAVRARLRKGDGLLAGDGQGAGRRPGCAAGPGAGTGGGAGHPGRVRERRRRLRDGRGRVASRAPGGPARRTRSVPRPVSCCTAGRERGCGPATCSTSCGPTTRPGSRPRSRRRRRRYGSGVRRRPPYRW